MKIFRFDPETGIYLGEDFADEAAMKRGDRVLPHDATTIEPPQAEAGQILFFNAPQKRWEVRSRPDGVCRRPFK